MYTNFSTRIHRTFLRFILAGIVLILCTAGNISSVARAREAERPQRDTVNALAKLPYPTKDSAANTLRLSDGKLITKHIINGSPEPPPGFEQERQAVILPKGKTATSNALGLQGSIWLLSCSAGAGGEIAAGYDQPIYTFNANGINAFSSDWSGWTNIYTGPANGGVMPLGSNPWPTWTDGTGYEYANNPLVASHQGVDGRATRGTIDDYWVAYDSTAPDPYIGHWTEHTWGDAIGDYMYSSQSAYGNPDGATTFYRYADSAEPLPCSVMASNSLPDGTLGIKRFYEARGYAVGTCYNQPTNNVIAGGFSFSQLKAEIDAGRPVLLGLENHSVVAFGYDDVTKTVKIHDGWDYADHTMPWGGSYQGMALQDVSIVNLVAIDKVALLTPANGEELLHRRATFDWSDTTGASNYQIAASKTTSFSTPLWKVTTTDSTYTPTADLPAGKVIYWRARAKVDGVWGPWSETWSFMTGKPPSVPVLVSPATASLTRDYTPLLDWNDSTVPTGAAAFDYYEVQVSLDKPFTDPVLIEAVTPNGVITASSYTPIADLAANTKYFWRVRSYNIDGQYSSWSTVWSFRTALLPPGNLTPAGGETVISRKPALSWDAVDGAEGYTIQISTDSGFATSLVNTPVAANTFTPVTNLPAHTTIYWRVRTTGANGPSRWTTASFNTQ